jgi:hypothetical protein
MRLPPSRFARVQASSAVCSESSCRLNTQWRRGADGCGAPGTRTRQKIDDWSLSLDRTASPPGHHRAAICTPTQSRSNAGVTMTFASDLGSTSHHAAASDSNAPAVPVGSHAGVSDVERSDIHRPCHVPPVASAHVSSGRERACRVARRKRLIVGPVRPLDVGRAFEQLGAGGAGHKCQGVLPSAFAIAANQLRAQRRERHCRRQDIAAASLGLRESREVAGLHAQHKERRPHARTPRPERREGRRHVTSAPLAPLQTRTASAGTTARATGRRCSSSVRVEDAQASTPICSAAGSDREAGPWWLCWTASDNATTSAKAGQASRRASDTRLGDVALASRWWPWWS